MTDDLPIKHVLQCSTRAKQTLSPDAFDPPLRPSPPSIPSPTTTECPAKTDQTAWMYRLIWVFAGRTTEHSWNILTTALVSVRCVSTEFFYLKTLCIFSLFQYKKRPFYVYVVFFVVFFLLFVRFISARQTMCYGIILFFVFHSATLMELCMFPKSRNTRALRSLSIWQQHLDA